MEEVFRESYGRAARTWPQFVLSEADWEDHVRKTVASFDALHSVSVADLYLALGCLKGIPEAVECLRGLMAPECKAAATRLKGSHYEPSDIGQLLLMHVLVPEPARRPRLAAYGGRGPLRAWLRVTLARLMGQLLDRRQETELAMDDLILSTLASPDMDTPERTFLQRETQAHLRRAAAQAFATLSAAERVALRQYYGQGVGIDGLAKLWGQHRSSAARRVLRARSTFQSLVRRALMAQLQLPPGAVEQLLAQLTSRWAVGLSDFTHDVRPQ